MCYNWATFRPVGLLLVYYFALYGWLYKFQSLLITVRHRGLINLSEVDIEVAIHLNAEFLEKLTELLGIPLNGLGGLDAVQLEYQLDSIQERGGSDIGVFEDTLQPVHSQRKEVSQLLFSYLPSRVPGEIKYSLVQVLLELRRLDNPIDSMYGQAKSLGYFLSGTILQHKRDNALTQLEFVDNPEIFFGKICTLAIEEFLSKLLASGS